MIHSRIGSCACAGQALAESLLVGLVLGTLFLAIPWLGRFQDLVLQAGHASRFAAFSLARDSNLRPLAEIRDHFFSGASHQWATSHGERIVAADPQVQLGVSESSDPGVSTQPGGDDPEASIQRRGLSIGEPDLLVARVNVSFPLWSAVQGAPGLAIASSYPSVTRSVALLVDAGHASDDVSAQQRVARSGPAWTHMADTSYSLGRRITGVAKALDNGWGREAPSFDWLEPWAGRLPTYLLVDRAGNSP